MTSYNFLGTKKVGIQLCLFYSVFVLYIFRDYCSIYILIFLLGKDITINGLNFKTHSDDINIYLSTLATWGLCSLCLLNRKKNLKPMCNFSL